MTAVAESTIAPAAEPSVRPEGRYWEIDLARTTAIAMMVAYHVVYDVDLLAPGRGPNPFTGFWGAVPEATGSLFLAVAGVALAVADARLRARGASFGQRMRRHGRHAAVVLGAATVVSLATRVAFDERYVRFGILHAIGLALLIGAITAGLGRVNVLLGLVVVAAGLLVSPLETDSAWLAVVGADSSAFSSVDHWPLLPWVGPLLIGVGIGSALYPGGVRAPRLRARLGRAPSPRLTSPGRRSLAVYLGHQLVLIPIVWTILVVAGEDVPWPF